MVGRTRAWLEGRTLVLWTIAFWLLCLVAALHWGPVHAHPSSHPATDL
jgi:hypothetical protein